MVKLRVFTIVLILISGILFSPISYASFVSGEEELTSEEKFELMIEIVNASRTYVEDRIVELQSKDVPVSNEAVEKLSLGVDKLENALSNSDDNLDDAYENVLDSMNNFQESLEDVEKSAKENIVEEELDEAEEALKLFDKIVRTEEVQNKLQDIINQKDKKGENTENLKIVLDVVDSKIDRAKDLLESGRVDDAKSELIGKVKSIDETEKETDGEITAELDVEESLNSSNSNWDAVDIMDTVSTVVQEEMIVKAIIEKPARIKIYVEDVTEHVDKMAKRVDDLPISKEARDVSNADLDKMREKLKKLKIKAQQEEERLSNVKDKLSDEKDSYLLKLLDEKKKEKILKDAKNSEIDISTEDVKTKPRKLKIYNEELENTEVTADPLDVMNVENKIYEEIEKDNSDASEALKKITDFEKVVKKFERKVKRLDNNVEEEQEWHEENDWIEEDFENNIQSIDSSQLKKKLQQARELLDDTSNSIKKLSKDDGGLLEKLNTMNNLKNDINSDFVKVKKNVDEIIEVGDFHRKVDKKLDKFKKRLNKIAESSEVDVEDVTRKLNEAKKLAIKRETDSDDKYSLNNIELELDEFLNEEIDDTIDEFVYDDVKVKMKPKLSIEEEKKILEKFNQEFDKKLKNKAIKTVKEKLKDKPESVPEKIDDVIDKIEKGVIDVKVKPKSEPEPKTKPKPESEPKKESEPESTPTNSTTTKSTTTKSITTKSTKTKSTTTKSITTNSTTTKSTTTKSITTKSTKTKSTTT